MLKLEEAVRQKSSEVSKLKVQRNEARGAGIGGGGGGGGGGGDSAHSVSRLQSLLEEMNYSHSQERIASQTKIIELETTLSIKESELTAFRNQYKSLQNQFQILRAGAGNGVEGASGKKGVEYTEQLVILRRDLEISKLSAELYQLMAKFQEVNKTKEEYMSSSRTQIYELKDNLNRAVTERETQSQEYEHNIQQYTATIASKDDQLDVANHRIVELDAVLSNVQYELGLYRSNTLRITTMLSEEQEKLKIKVLELSGSISDIFSHAIMGSGRHEGREDQVMEGTAALQAISNGFEGLLYELRSKVSDSDTVAKENEDLFIKIKKISTSLKTIKSKAIERVKKLEIVVAGLQSELRSKSDLQHQARLRVEELTEGLQTCRGEILTQQRELKRQQELSATEREGLELQVRGCFLSFVFFSFLLFYFISFLIIIIFPFLFFAF